MSIEKKLRSKFPNASINAKIDDRGILTLTGEADSWKEVAKIGHKAAKNKKVHNVVNKISVRGEKAIKKDYSPYIKEGKNKGVICESDIVIIGAGITGCGIARELSKYELKIDVLEMSSDVATGATKCNNGNIHPGYACYPGTLKAKLNSKGNFMYTKWSEELGFDLERVGAMGYCTDSKVKLALRAVYKVAKMNNCPAELLNNDEALNVEPGLKDFLNGEKIKMALYFPTMGIVEPYQVCVALAENAATNGVNFHFDTTVCDIEHNNGKVTGVLTNKGLYKARYVINCAGVYADEISAMAGDECYTIHPRKGTIAILDKNKKPETRTLCQYISVEELKTTLNNIKNETKGGGMCHTPAGNILMGPSAKEVPNKEDKSTDAESLGYAMGRGGDSTVDNGIRYGDVIRFFAAPRPADYKEDFFIEMSPITDGFINVGGIQSPGLASAPAIAEMVENILLDSANKQGFEVVKKIKWNPIRQKPVEFAKLSRKEQDEIIKKDPSFGKIICRCESITEGEIIQAIHSPVPPTTVDGIKRRTRAGMGRCQGGFCQPRVLEILAKEENLKWTDVTLKGQNSEILITNSRPNAKPIEINKKVVEEQK